MTWLTLNKSGTRCINSRPAASLSKLSDGRTFLIEHPNFIGFPAMERGQDKTVDDREGTHFLDGDLLPIAKVALSSGSLARARSRSERQVGSDRP